MTVDEIKASNKQEVHPPMNFRKLKEQLNMFLVATKIFFGELSVGSQCFRVLLNTINHHKSTFTAKERLDKKFAAKFLFAVDTRNQLWLKECKSAKNVTSAPNPSGEFNCYYSTIFSLPRKSYRILVTVKYNLEPFL